MLHSAKCHGGVDGRERDGWSGRQNGGGVGDWGGVTRRDGHINHLSDCRGFT